MVSALGPITQKQNYYYALLQALGTRLQAIADGNAARQVWPDHQSHRSSLNHKEIRQLAMALLSAAMTEPGSACEMEDQALRIQHIIAGVTNRFVRHLTEQNEGSRCELRETGVKQAASIQLKLENSYRHLCNRLNDFMRMERTGDLIDDPILQRGLSPEVLDAPLLEGLHCIMLQARDSGLPVPDWNGRLNTDYPLGDYSRLVIIGDQPEPLMNAPALLAQYLHNTRPAPEARASPFDLFHSYPLPQHALSALFPDAMQFVGDALHPFGFIDLTVPDARPSGMFFCAKANWPVPLPIGAETTGWFIAEIQTMPDRHYHAKQISDIIYKVIDGLPEGDPTRAGLELLHLQVHLLACIQSTENWQALYRDAYPQGKLDYDPKAGSFTPHVRHPLAALLTSPITCPEGMRQLDITTDEGKNAFIEQFCPIEIQHCWAEKHHAAHRQRSHHPSLIENSRQQQQQRPVLSVETSRL